MASHTEAGSTARLVIHAPNSRRYDASLTRILALVALFTATAAYESFHVSAVTNSDIWWHLSSGAWILQNNAIPHDGLFSQHAKLPWIDSSWGFDVLTAAAYRLFGLRGLPVLLMAFASGIAAVMFLLGRGRGKKFWPAVFLVAIAEGCIFPLQLRPALCSILLLSLELAILLHAKRNGKIRVLYWLPLLFVIWVNLDRQFSYGLLALALFCAAEVAECLRRQGGLTWLHAEPHQIPLAKLGAVFGITCLATLASPYTLDLHEMLWRSANSSAIDRYLIEFHSMRFRQPQDYLLMLLVMTAFFALGRRHSRDLFLIALLMVCAVISFRYQRDSWLVVVASVAAIGDAVARSEVQAREHGPSTTRTEKVITAAICLVVLAALIRRIPQQQPLMARVGQNFPVRASDYIRKSRLPQPLFNSYFWGGFLTWYLPEYPAAIDGRLELYGDAVNIPYFQLALAKIPLESNSDFARAQTVLIEANSPIAEALATLPDFRVVYRDDQAMVLVREH